MGLQMLPVTNDRSQHNRLAGLRTDLRLPGQRNMGLQLLLGVARGPTGVIKSFCLVLVLLGW